MAYHIRRIDNGDERSLHTQSAKGLRAAQAEAIIRANYTGFAHEVFCDQYNMVASVHVPWDGEGGTPHTAHNATNLVDFTHEADEAAQQANAAQVKYGSDWTLLGFITILVVAIAARMFWQ